MRNKKNFINPKTFAMLMVLVTSVLVITTTVSFQNTMATKIYNCPPFCADIDVEEAEEGNATMSESGMNQTTNSNMTGTN